MSDLLAQGSAWLASQQKLYASQAVTYYRDGAVPLKMTAVRGRTLTQVEDAQGLLMQVEVDDFVFATADLIRDGLAFLPISGDRITDPAGVFYEVMGLPSLSHFQWVGPYHDQIRVHTKKVAESGS